MDEKKALSSSWRYTVMVLPFVVLLAAWYTLTKLELWPHYFFPPPNWVVVSFADLTSKGIFSGYISNSLINLGIGVTAAFATAIPLGLLMGINDVTAKIFFPAINFFQSLAEIAWLPLIILWFGFGAKTICFLIWYTVFFPVLFSTLIGVTQVPKRLIDAVRTMGGSRRHIIFEVIIPSALPNLVNGIRLGIGYGWRALIAAEMIVGSGGLGYMIFRAREALLTEQVILGMITMGVLWLATDRLILKPLETMTIERWGLVTRAK